MSFSSHEDSSWMPRFAPMIASRAAGSLLIAGAQQYEIEVTRMLRLLASNGILTLGAAESAFVFEK